MNRDREPGLSLLATLEQCQAALHAAQIQNLRLSERLVALQASPTPAPTMPQIVRWHSSDSSIFLDDAYLIRGVAGTILWKMVSTYLDNGRRAFTNVELRVAPELRLPARHHNIEVRLAMLQQRLSNTGAAVQLDRSVRGHIQLDVQRALVLRVVDDAAPSACRPRANVPIGPRLNEMPAWLAAGASEDSLGRHERAGVANSFAA
jgi:hypothetical protein